MRVAARFTVGVTIGLIGGVLTEWSVLHLPFSLEPLSNSAAPWVLVAFVVALTARSITESLVLAVVTLVALVLGFYVAEVLRGWAVSRHQVEFWTATSVVVGPMVGLAAGCFRHAGRTAGAIGIGILGGVLTGEAVHGLTAIRSSSPADYWRAQFVLGFVVAIGLTLWRNRRRLLGNVPALIASCASWIVVSLGTLAVFRIT